MKNYFMFELKKFLKNRKTFFMVLAFVTFLGVVFYAINTQGLGDQQRKLDEELNQTRVLSQYTQQYNQENEEEYALGQNVSKQQQIIATQANGLIFDQPNWYLESGLELATLRLDMQDNDAFSELPMSLLPSKDAMYRNLVELETLNEDSMPTMVNSESAAGFMREVLFIFGFFAFGYLLVFGSDISMDDFEHSTMIESYPITTLQKISSKLLIYSIGTTAMTIVSFLFSGLIVSLIWEVGNFSYPVGLYLLGNFATVPLWSYILLFFLYYFILAIHVFLLTMALNRYVRNSIATIIVGLVLFILPYLYPVLTNHSNFLPFHYYNIIALFDGQFAMEAAGFMDLGIGMLVLILYSILLFFIIFRKDKKQSNR